MTLKDLRELTDMLLEKDEELVRSKNEWEATFDSVPDLIAILDTNSIVTRVNKSLVNKLKIKPSDIIGKRCYELFHKTSSAPEDCPHIEMVKTGEMQHRTKYIKDLDGWYEITLTPLFDKNGDNIGSVHILHDITELKKTEFELVETNLSLDAANQELRAISEELTDRMAAMEKFVSECRIKYDNVFDGG